MRSLGVSIVACGVLLSSLACPAWGADDDPSAERKAKTAKKTKGKPAPDKDEEKPAKKVDAKEPPEEDDNDFGAARRTGNTASKKGERPNRDEIEMARLKRTLTKRLGSREEGTFLIEASERSAVSPGEENDPGEPPDRGTVAWVQNGVQFSVSYEIFQNRSEAVDFLAEYMVDQLGPKKKRSTSRSPRRNKDDGPPEPPPPERNFKIVRYFPANVPQSVVQEFRDRLIAEHRQQIAERQRQQQGRYPQ